MKRLSAFLLLSLYLFFSGSQVLSFHYCGGTLAETRINALASCCCDDSKTSSQDDDGCCENTIKPVKQPDTYLHTNTLLVNPNIVATLPQAHSWCCTNHYPSNHKGILPPPTYPPPDARRQVAAYLQYHALLLYA